MTETQPLGMLNSGPTKVENSAESTSSYSDAEAWEFLSDPLARAYESVVRGDPTRLSPSGFQHRWAGPGRESGILFSQDMMHRRTFW
jgi:hypothetical protein